MALIKCNECGKEISDKAKTCPNCSYPIKKEKVKENGKKILSQSKQTSFKIFKILIMVCIVIFMIFSIKLVYQHLYQRVENQKEIKHKQEIISKYVGGNTTDIINKVWKTEHNDYYETYEFEDDYTCEYYKSGYTFEFNEETLPSFSKNEKYYYKVEEREENDLIITIFEIDFNTEDINIIEKLSYFPPKTNGNLYFNESIYRDNKIFLPDDKPYYEHINE